MLRADCVLSSEEEVLLVSSTEETVVQRAVQYQAELESLSSTLSSAVSDEDYRLAASTRDRINLMGLQDPVAMLQSSLDRAVAEERYQDAAGVMAEGTLQLVGTWVGRRPGVDDPYGVVMVLEQGVAMCRLVGSTLGEAANGSYSRVMEIFPTFKEGGGDTVAALYGEPVVRYVETNSTKNFFSKNRGSVASQADMQRIPAQVTDASKNAFSFSRPTTPATRAGMRPPLLCKCCRTMLVPQEGEEGGATLDPRDIGGFDSQYSFHAADEAELDPRAPTDPLVVDEMDLAGVAAMVEEVGGVAALVAAARQEAPAAAGKVQPLRSFTACLRVPGSGWNMKPIFTVCVPASHTALVGKTSPSLWFPLHEKQPLTCTRCKASVGFRYTARPDSDGSRGEDFDGLFFSALSPEEGSVVRAGRLPDKLRFTRLQVPVPTGRTEPWSLPGLFVGSYGSHGPEMISVHVTDDGEIVGTKVTGDPNVPSGEVTFKARKAEPGSTKMVLPTSDIVTGCYPGKGRVAQEGFKQAKWVDGVLLSIDRAQATRRLAEFKLMTDKPDTDKRAAMELQLEAFASADLSFVWHLKGQRSMVLFSRQHTS